MPPNSFGDLVNAIIVQEDGICISGKHHGKGTHGDVLTTKLNLAGDVVWEYCYEGEGNPTFEGAQDMIQLNNQLIIGGSRQLDSAGRGDFLMLVLHEPDGKLIEVEETDFHPLGSEGIRRPHRINEQEFYVFGYASKLPSGDGGIVIQKYGLPTSINVPSSAPSLQVYPQPAGQRLV